MKNKFEFDVSLKKSEVAQYNLYHIRWLVILDIIGFGLFFYLVYLSFNHPEPETRELLRTISIWGAIALAIGLSQPLIILVQIYILKADPVKNLMALRSYKFSEIGIQIYSAGKEAQKGWSDISNVIYIGSILLLFTSSKLAYVIPRRCFESKKDWEDFRGFLLKRTKK